MDRRDNSDPSQPAAGSPGSASDRSLDRRKRSVIAGARRAAITRAMARYRLDDFERLLAAISVTVFGPQASVVAHLRTIAGRQWVTFVVDAADASAALNYEEFLPRERMFWTAYAHLPKPPNAPFIVAVRPARGWCRVEALAPLFSVLPPPQTYT